MGSGPDVVTAADIMSALERRGSQRAPAFPLSVSGWLSSSVHRQAQFIRRVSSAMRRYVNLQLG